MVFHIKNRLLSEVCKEIIRIIYSNFYSNLAVENVIGNKLFWTTIKWKFTKKH